MDALFDMHCHLDFAPNAAEAARAIEDVGAGAFSATVLPGDCEACEQLIGSFSRVRVGVGLHPWWIKDEAHAHAASKQVVELLAEHDFVGEIGLDFSPTHDATRPFQYAAFERIIEACARRGNKTLTIHSVQAADAVLDVLEKFNATHTCACILHWFSGSSQALTRACNMGCFISLGAKSLATKRGRAYAQQIPLQQLLLETDWPPADTDYVVDDMQAQMHEVVGGIARLRDIEVGRAIDVITETSTRLLHV